MSNSNRRPPLNDAIQPNDTMNDYGSTVPSEAMLNYPLYDVTSINQLARLAKSHKRRDGSNNAADGSLSSTLTYTDLSYQRMPLPDALRPSFITTLNPPIILPPNNTTFPTISTGMNDTSLREMGMPGRIALRRPSFDTYTDASYFSQNPSYVTATSSSNLDPLAIDSPRRTSDATENEYDDRNNGIFLKPSDSNVMNPPNTSTHHYRKNSSGSGYETSLNDVVPGTHQLNDWMFENNDLNEQSDPAQPRIVLNTAEQRSGMDGVLLRRSATNSMIVGEIQMKQPARVVYYTSHGSRVNFYLQKDESTIGRKEDNTYVIDSFAELPLFADSHLVH